MSIKLLKDLNFAEKLNSTEAVTEAGKECLKSYRGWCYTNAPTCGIVNGFIQEARRFSFDTGVQEILESVLKYVTENNISWKLASACEQVSNNDHPYGYIAKVGVEQVNKLLEMDEANIVAYIKSGALKNVQYIPEFRAVCKEVYSSTINEVHAPTYSVTTPISFVAIEEGKQYFKVCNKTYCISEGKVTEAADYQNPTFESVNALVASFRQEDDNLVYECKTSINGEARKFTVSENAIQFTSGKINEKFEDAISFKTYCDNLSRIMPTNEAIHFMSICGAIATVFEHAENICAIDCAKILTSSNGSVCSVIEAKDNVNMSVHRSYGNGVGSKNYDFMVEALNDMAKISGVDLKSMYEARINEDTKKANPEEYAQLQEQLADAKAEQFNVRRRKIAQLAEQFKNDPAKIALLNTLAKDLAILEKE